MIFTVIFYVMNLVSYLKSDWRKQYQAYYVLDEVLIAGELQESSKKTVARLVAVQVCNFAVL